MYNEKEIFVLYIYTIVFPRNDWTNPNIFEETEKKKWAKITSPEPKHHWV